MLFEMKPCCLSSLAPAIDFNFLFKKKKCTVDSTAACLEYCEQCFYVDDFATSQCGIHAADSIMGKNTSP